MTDAQQAQLDRIEGDLRVVRGEVEHLKRRASLWGAVSAGLVSLITHLAGCF